MANLSSESPGTSLSLLGKKNLTLMLDTPFTQKPTHPTSFLRAFSVKLLPYTEAWIKLLKDMGSCYKLAVFSWLMPSWVETTNEIPLRGVSLTVTKKVRVRGKRWTSVGITTAGHSVSASQVSTWEGWRSALLRWVLKGLLSKKIYGKCSVKHEAYTKVRCG